MTAQEVIAQSKDLPVVSETARKLIVLLNNPETHRDEIVQTVRCDNVLTAKLLRVCNSAYTGLREPVASLDQAVFVLGDRAIYRMVCAIGFGGTMGFEHPGCSVEANGLWVHSLSIGLGAERLTEGEPYVQFMPSVAFTAGLLHDLGKLVLNQILTPKARAEMRDKIARESLSRFEAEKAVLGVDHAEVGACLLKKWALPEVIVEAVAHHHAPLVRPVVRLSAVVYLSNCAAHLCGTSPGFEAEAARANESVAEALGLEAKQAEELVAGAQEAMKNISQFLRVV
jgi:putative nucleotidyltransferase with HDIG domain